MDLSLEKVGKMTSASLTTFVFNHFQMNAAHKKSEYDMYDM